jgi:hypothetical protein
MTLLRRAPREVYRVYSEEEYLDGAGSEIAAVAEWPVDGSPVVAEAAQQVVLGHRLRRAAGVAMLAGAVGAVGGLVCLNLARAHVGSGAGREGLVAATHPARAAAASSPAADDVPAPMESSRPVIVRPVETAGSRVPSQSRRSRAGAPALRLSDRLPVHHAARRPAGVAVLADDAHPHRPAGEASEAPVSAAAQSSASAPVPASASASASTPVQPASEAASTTTTVVSSPPEHPAPETRAEFGFER